MVTFVGAALARDLVPRCCALQALLLALRLHSGAGPLWELLGHSLARLGGAASGELSAGEHTSPGILLQITSGRGPGAGGAAYRALMRALHAEGVVRLGTLDLLVR